jgi:hypothetical protein
MIYKIKAVDRIIGSCFPLQRYRMRPDRRPEGGYGVIETHTHQPPAAAAPLLDAVRAAGPGCPAGGGADDRALNFCFCALMNSR